MSYRSFIQLDKVYVAESLFDDDYNTTRDILDSVIYSRNKPSWFEVENFQIGSKEDLNSFFNLIKKEVKEDNRFPIIHLEMHGHENKNSVVLNNRQEVKWNYLIKRFEEINVLTQLNLVVFLGACFGLNILKVFGPSSRAPFFGLLAPHQEIPPTTLSKYYKTFYKELFASNNFTTAIDRVKEEKLDNISYISAGAYYKLYIQSYFKKIRKPERRNEKIKKLVDNTLSERDYKYLDKERLTILYSLKTPQLENELHDELFSKFFMTDLYPTNEKRFEILK